MKHDFASATLNRENGKRYNKNKVVLRQQYLFYTVEPPLIATSLGMATFFVLAADSPYIVYCLSLTNNGNGH